MEDLVDADGVRKERNAEALIEKKKSRATGRSETRSRTKKSGEKMKSSGSGVDTENKSEFLSDLKQAVEKT